MMHAGHRKAALYLSTLAPADRRALLSALPATAARALQPLVDDVVSRGWNDADLVRRALASEIVGLTNQSTLAVDTLFALGKALPADWAARVYAANAAVDAKFLIALLDKPQAQRVQDSLARVPRLPDRLRDALLAEAGDSVRASA